MINISVVFATFEFTVFGDWITLSNAWNIIRECEWVLLRVAIMIPTYLADSGIM